MHLGRLGMRIREYRERRGLKQVDLARALQISHQAVSKWERGDNAPDLSILLDLARLLGVTTDRLLGRDDAGDTFPATVLVTSLNGFAERAAALPPREVAAFANGIFHQVTEAVLAHDGVPVKYVGDGFLGFFSGPEHAERALRAGRFAAGSLRNPDFRVLLHSGEIYLGTVGHPEYGALDIIGETVNTGFLALAAFSTLAGASLGITAATAALLADREGLGAPLPLPVPGRADTVAVHPVPAASTAG